MTIVEIEYRDYGTCGEYGMFGKVVARSDVSGMTKAEVDAEKVEMRTILGSHVVAIEVEVIPPA
jgi:hypothetical protein